MKTSTNREGLTFEEWVCAAGVAAFSGDTVRPYSSSYSTYKYTGFRRPAHLPPVVLLCTSTSRLPAHLCKRVSHTTVFYPRAIRKAWRAGEDPTEWRQHEGS